VFNSLPRRKAFIVFTITAVLMTVLTGYVLMGQVQTGTVLGIQDSMDTWRHVFVSIRWGVMALIVLSWTKFLRGLVMLGVIAESTFAQLGALRWRFATWLVILELVLGQGAIIKMLAGLAEVAP
jgi:hypothetical protein